MTSASAGQSPYINRAEPGLCTIMHIHVGSYKMHICFPFSIQSCPLDANYFILLKLNLRQSTVQSFPCVNLLHIPCMASLHRRIYSLGRIYYLTLGIQNASSDFSKISIQFLVSSQWKKILRKCEK